MIRQHDRKILVQEVTAHRKQTQKYNIARAQQITECKQKRSNLLQQNL